MADIYLYEIDKKFLPVLVPFGLRSKRDGVRVSEDGPLSATFGWLRIETTVSNVDGAHITRGYRWWTAIGPRTSFADDGLSFGTNSKAGVCIHFKEKVPSALRRKGHSAITVTVADLEGLKRTLSP
jgi:hypothetical protein